MAVTTPDTVADDQVAAVRAFNRFYTRLIGVLDERLSSSRFSLTEARVLFELAQRAPDPVPVADVRAALGLDAGYLSRIINRCAADGLIERERSSADGRRVVLRLTDAGYQAFETLDRASTDDVRGLLDGLDGERRRRLLDAMGAIEDVFGERPAATARGYLVRPVEAGDLGWIVERHGTLYAREHGWNVEFEGMVARIAAEYAERRGPAGEACWIAEVDGERAGSVACTRGDDETARLRVLLVEPWARGLGMGGRLVDECLRFARGAGYRRITLFTSDVLVAARRVYQRAGFTLDDEEAAHSFGQDVVHQNWSRTL